MGETFRAAASVERFAPERVYDLPAGADRLIARSVGISHVWVNGELIRRDGVDLEKRPGTLLRFSGSPKDDE